MEDNGTGAIGSGVEYPTLQIDGKTYTVKFTRAAIYRLDKAGFDLRSLPTELKSWFPHKEGDDEVPGRVRFSVMIDILHAILGRELRCTAEELAEMIDPTRTPEVATALILAMSKMQPPAVRQPQATAATPGEAVQ